MAVVDVDSAIAQGDPEKGPPAPGAAAAPGPARRRVWARRLQLGVPIGLIVLIVLACFLGPVIFDVPRPTNGDILESGLPMFSDGHLLGTDQNGNDILSRLLYGGRASLFIAVMVNLIGVVVGGGLGALSGQLGGAFDTVLMRILDVFIAFPSLVLTLAVAQSLGASVRNTIFALSFFSIPAVARISRSAVLRLRELPFMAAAELSGTPRWRVLLRHIAPNIGPQLLSFAMLNMGVVIIIEGALSFLGLGIPPPDPSWGNMIFDGQQSLTATPWLVVWPSIALMVTVISFNLLGENLRSLWSSR
ncbi:MAG: ABC transporter permease [Frankia sp.]|nr:ABC transporter permease [Frankia sp.]